MEDRKLICELCDWFGLDNLYPYTDNEKILKEFKEVLEHEEDIHLALLTKSIQLKKKDKILDILKPYFKGAIFPSAINFNFSPEELNLLKKEWLDGRD